MMPRRFNYLDSNQRPGVGPRRPEPHPDGTHGAKLLPCPTCKQKGLLYYYAPTELGYRTECIKCGGTFSYRARADMDNKEIMRLGGWTPSQVRVHHYDPITKHPVFEGKKRWEEILERREIGWKRWRSLGKGKRVDDKGRLK